MSNSVRIGLYVLSVLLLGAYAIVLWWALHPDVPTNYRAYYIDQTTTCMDQPVPGTYEPGTIVSFLPEGADEAKPLKPCGWEGPAGDGTHAVGTSSRLRFAYGTPPTGPLMLSLEMLAVEKDDVVMPQSVVISADGQHVATLKVDTPSATPFSVPLPAGIAADGKVELLLEFPDAVKMGNTDPQTRWRSIKLLSAGIVPGV
jgi:hypothetical protein